MFSLLSLFSLSLSLSVSLLSLPLSLCSLSLPQFKAHTIDPIPGSHGQYRVKYTPTDAGTFLLRVALLLPEQAHDNYGLNEVVHTMQEMGR